MFISELTNYTETVLAERIESRTSTQGKLVSGGALLAAATGSTGVLVGSHFASLIVLGRRLQRQSTAYIIVTALLDM